MTLKLKNPDKKKRKEENRRDFGNLAARSTLIQGVAANENLSKALERRKKKEEEEAKERKTWGEEHKKEEEGKKSRREIDVDKLKTYRKELKDAFKKYGFLKDFDVFGLGKSEEDEGNAEKAKDDSQTLRKEDRAKQKSAATNPSRNPTEPTGEEKSEEEEEKEDKKEEEEEEKEDEEEDDEEEGQNKDQKEDNRTKSIIASSHIFDYFIKDGLEVRGQYQSCYDLLGTGVKVDVTMDFAPIPGLKLSASGSMSAKRCSATFVGVYVHKSNEDTTDPHYTYEAPICFARMVGAYTEIEVEAAVEAGLKIPNPLPEVSGVDAIDDIVSWELKAKATAKLQGGYKYLHLRVSDPDPQHYSDPASLRHDFSRLLGRGKAEVKRKICTFLNRKSRHEATSKYFPRPDRYFGTPSVENLVNSLEEGILALSKQSRRTNYEKWLLSTGRKHLENLKTLVAADESDPIDRARELIFKFVEPLYDEVKYERNWPFGHISANDLKKHLDTRINEIAEQRAVTGTLPRRLHRFVARAKKLQARLRPYLEEMDSARDCSLAFVSHEGELGFEASAEAKLTVKLKSGQGEKQKGDSTKGENDKNQKDGLKKGQKELSANALLVAAHGGIRRATYRFQSYANANKRDSAGKKTVDSRRVIMTQDTVITYTRTHLDLAKFELVGGEKDDKKSPWQPEWAKEKSEAATIDSMSYVSAVAFWYHDKNEKKPALHGTGSGYTFGQSVLIENIVQQAADADEIADERSNDKLICALAITKDGWAQLRNDDAAVDYRTRLAHELRVPRWQLEDFLEKQGISACYDLLQDPNFEVDAVLIEASFGATPQLAYHEKEGVLGAFREKLVNDHIAQYAKYNPATDGGKPEVGDLHAIRLRYRIADQVVNDKERTSLGLKWAGVGAGFTLTKIDRAGSEGVFDVATVWFGTHAPEKIINVKKVQTMEPNPSPGGTKGPPKQIISSKNQQIQQAPDPPGYFEDQKMAYDRGVPATTLFYQ